MFVFRFWVSVLSLVCVGTISVSATYLDASEGSPNAVKQVLSIYGYDIDAVDVAHYQRQFEEQQIEYIGLYKQYQHDSYFKATQEVAEVQVSEPVDYYANIERDMRYLESLVSVGAELSDIFAAEAEYRMSLAEWELYKDTSVNFDINNYQLSGTTLDDVNHVVSLMEELRDELNSKVLLPDIGVLEDLRTPTVGSFRVTSNFGYRVDPFTTLTAYHQGLDLGATTGTDVISLFSGVVLQAGDTGDGYGNKVLVSHVNEFQTFYCHLNSIDVAVGDYVTQYQKIGEVGSTGRSTGPHLHLGVYINGKAVDPALLFGK